MPKREMGNGSGGESQDSAMFDFGKPLDVTEDDTAELPEATHGKELVKQLHKDVKEAKTIEGVVNALYRAEKNELAQAVLGGVSRAEHLLVARPELSAYTIKNVLEDSDIFKNKVFQTEYPYVDKKVRTLLLSYLKEKLL